MSFRRFKWVHLNERLTYERAVYKQRLRAEIAQAKRESNFFSQNIEFSEKLQRKKKKSKKKSEVEESEDQKQQKGGRSDNSGDFVKVNKKGKRKPMTVPTDDSERTLEDRTDLLKSLFGGVKR